MSVAAPANVLAARSSREREERELEERRPSGPARRQRASPRPATEDTGRPPHWAFESWPFPLASLWTSLAMMLAFSWAGSVAVTLAAMGAGLWAGVTLDRWLRLHRRRLAPLPWALTLLGVDPPGEPTRDRRTSRSPSEDAYEEPHHRPVHVPVA